MAGVGDSFGDGAGGDSSDSSFGRRILRHSALADPPAPPPADTPLSFHSLLHKLIPPPYREAPVEAPHPPPPPPQNSVVEVKQCPVFRVPIPHDLPPGPWEPEDILPPRPPNYDSLKLEECGKGLGDQNDSFVNAPANRPPSQPNRYEKASRNSQYSVRENRLRGNRRPGYGNDTPASNPRSDLWHGYPKIDAGDAPSGYRGKQKMYETGYQYQRKHMDLGHSSHALCWKPKTNEQRQPQGLVEKKKVKAEWVAVTGKQCANRTSEAGESVSVTRKQCVNRNSEAGSRNQQELTDDGSQTVCGNDSDQIEFASNFDKLKIDGSVMKLKAPKDFEDGSSSGHELESGEEKESLSSEDGGVRQVDILANGHTASLTIQGDSAQTHIMRRPPTPLTEFDGYQPLRRKQISRHGLKNRGRACRSDIETLLPGFVSVYESLLPSDDEKEKQNLFLKSLEEIINKEWPNVKLHLYGSCANSFGFSNSDVDICLSIDECAMSKHDMLLKLADILQSENYQDVEAIANARVPIVKLTDPSTGICCDICINNLLAVANTKLLSDYAKIDNRLHQLAFIVKHWARSREVNNTFEGTLSSYAYVLLCINFLQLRQPAILPCLQEMELTYQLTVEDTICAYFDQVDEVHNFGALNDESLAELVWGFFHYWAFCHNYTRDVISVRTGSIISKKIKNWTTRVGNDRHLLCIEDPFETSHDLGRHVDRCSIEMLRSEFKRAANVLQYDRNPSVTLFNLDDL